MKRFFAILILPLLLCSFQPNRAYLVECDRPTGEIVQFIDGKYHCIVSQSGIPEGAKVLSVLPARQELGRYHDFRAVETRLNEMALKHPDRCRVLEIGRSVENRPILAIRFEPEKPSPAMLFVGAHHAREWMSVEVPMALAGILAENPSGDKRIERYLDSFDIWIIPMLNPDGHQHSVDRERLWRKNRRPLQAGTFGVDLNRNYAFKWNNMGAVSNTESDVYPGPSAFSEPETQALRDLSGKIPFLGAITYHTYGNMILYPWGSGYEMAPYQERLERIAIAMAKLSGKSDRKQNGSDAIKDYKYAVMKGTELYAASGDMCDYFYSRHGIPAFTYEMTNSAGGFINSDEEIDPTVNLVLPMSLELFEAVPKEFCIIAGKVSDAYGNPVKTSLYFKNIEFPIETDPETGRFHHVVPLGEHYIRYKADGADRFMNVKLEKTFNWLNVVIGAPAKARLSGQIVGTDGNPLQRTAVLFDQQGNEVARSINSAKFSFPNLPTGSYVLKVYGIDKTDSYQIRLLRDMEFEAPSS